ncbi:hypothetical protein L6164_013336 [Bauhinia variegata]|uniref:Uncharacterized protein n=1 Tax=Bauhinia variegata TaxID=167791 RepID=A0ACB9PC15_BAUVA|nr:hypothetical protein L6164_013336 [Bauhinia variegata]
MLCYDENNPYNNCIELYVECVDVGLQWPIVEDVNNVIKLYSVKHNVKFKVKKYTRQWYSICCKQSNVGCPWRLRAGKLKKCDGWMITKYVTPHTYMSAMLNQDYYHLNSDLICDEIVRLVRVNPNLKPSEIIQQIKNMHNNTISHRKEWIARQKAL